MNNYAYLAEHLGNIEGTQNALFHLYITCSKWLLHLDLPFHQKNFIMTPANNERASFLVEKPPAGGRESVPAGGYFIH